MEEMDRITVFRWKEGGIIHSLHLQQAKQGALVISCREKDLGEKAREKYENSKELNKNICGDGEPSFLVRCFSEHRRQATTRNGFDVQRVLLWDISRCFPGLSPVIPQCLYCESCRNDATFAESTGWSEDKLVMHHHVCVDVHESFSPDNQQIHHPNIPQNCRTALQCCAL